VPHKQKTNKQTNKQFSCKEHLKWTSSWFKNVVEIKCENILLPSYW
jgi:hypothetical protein